MKRDRLNSISLNNIRIKDYFWNRYTSLVTDKILPYQWEILNDRVEGAEKSHCIRNFEIAAGKATGEFHGFVFQDTDLAKWIEAAAYTLSFFHNNTLMGTVDDAIELIAEAQCPDGYINTYFTVKEPNGRFKNLSEGHELYTAGHMMEAAAAYYEVTGKDRFLKIMCRMADLLCDVFNSKEYENAVPGHQEVEIGLIKLYRVTGERKYLDLAKAFIDRRGTEPNYLATEKLKPDWVDVFHNPDPFIPEYAQCDEPVRMQKTARGHAVRAVYMYSAMADLAYEYDDEELLTVCKTLYDDITCKQMYITGGIGQSGLYERFTVDYDLPNDRNYSETCASIGLALFCRRMAQITHEEKYVSTMETALYNTVLAGVALDGESFFYVNPLEVWPANLIPYTSLAHIKPVRQKWFPCACCPPNIARTLASLGEYVVFTDDDSLWINMYVGCECETEIGGVPVTLTVESGLPFAGRVLVKVHATQSFEGRLMLRIPEYASDCRIRCECDGKITECGVSQGGVYQEIPLSFGRTGGFGEGSPDPACDVRDVTDAGAINDAETMSGVETVSGVGTDMEARGEYDISVMLEFEMPTRFIYANSRVQADAGKVAVVKGPMVYAAEEIDNGSDLSEFIVDTGMGIQEEYDTDLMGGCMTLILSGYRQVSTDKSVLYGTEPPETVPAKLKLIPYAYWNNRGIGEMRVWIRHM